MGPTAGGDWNQVTMKHVSMFSFEMSDALIPMGQTAGGDWSQFAMKYVNIFSFTTISAKRNCYIMQPLWSRLVKPTIVREANGARESRTVHNFSSRGQTEVSSHCHCRKGGSQQHTDLVK